LATRGVRRFHPVKQSEALGCGKFRRRDFLGLIDHERLPTQKPALFVGQARQRVENLG